MQKFIRLASPICRRTQLVRDRKGDVWQTDLIDFKIQQTPYGHHELEGMLVHPDRSGVGSHHPRDQLSGSDGEGGAKPRKGLSLRVSREYLLCSSVRYGLCAIDRRPAALLAAKLDIDLLLQGSRSLWLKYS